MGQGFVDCLLAVNAIVFSKGQVVVWNETLFSKKKG